MIQHAHDKIRCPEIGPPVAFIRCKVDIDSAVFAQTTKASVPGPDRSAQIILLAPLQTNLAVGQLPNYGSGGIALRLVP